jgi:hypothetical protein
VLTPNYEKPDELLYVTHLTAPHGISMRDGLFITFDGFVFFPYEELIADSSAKKIGIGQVPLELRQRRRPSQVEDFLERVCVNRTEYTGMLSNGTLFNLTMQMIINFTRLNYNSPASSDYVDISKFNDSTETQLIFNVTYMNQTIHNRYGKVVRECATQPPEEEPATVLCGGQNRQTNVAELVECRSGEAIALDTGGDEEEGEGEDEEDASDAVVQPQVPMGNGTGFMPPARAAGAALLPLLVFLTDLR